MFWGTAGFDAKNGGCVSNPGPRPDPQCCNNPTGAYVSPPCRPFFSKMRLLDAVQRQHEAVLRQLRRLARHRPVLILKISFFLKIF